VTGFDFRSGSTESSRLGIGAVPTILPCAMRRSSSTGRFGSDIVLHLHVCGWGIPSMTTRPSRSLRSLDCTRRASHRLALDPSRGRHYCRREVRDHSRRGDRWRHGPTCGTRPRATSHADRGGPARVSPGSSCASCVPCRCPRPTGRAWPASTGRSSGRTTGSKLNRICWWKNPVRSARRRASRTRTDSRSVDVDSATESESVRITRV